MPVIWKASKALSVPSQIERATGGKTGECQSPTACMPARNKRAATTSLSNVVAALTRTRIGPVTRASDKSTTGEAAAMNEPLPLTSPNWWPLTRTLSHVYVQAGHGKIADYGFLLAVNTRTRVRVKLDQLNLRNKPPTLKSLLLPPGKYELEAHIHNTWMLRQCDEGRRYLRAPYAMFFWAPDVKKVWPSDTPEGSLLDTPLKFSKHPRRQRPRLSPMHRLLRS